MALHPKEIELRTALALNRGMELLDTLQRETHATVEHHEARRIGYLEELYSRIHHDLFQDWEGHEGGAPGEITSGEKRTLLREAIRNILCANGEAANATPNGLFDANGFVVKHNTQELANILATFYEAVRNIEPFDYGNKLTADFFMVALSKLPAFAEVYPAGIDFRRLNQDDLQSLYATPLDHRKIVAAFTHATDFSHTHALENTTPDYTQYQKWDKHVEYVSGVPFLSHMYNGTLCLVTVNGGLVPFDAQLKGKLEKHFKDDGLVSEFPPIHPNTVVGYLPGTNELRTKRNIDGYEIKGGAAPLFCTDINIMTGLRPLTHKNFVEWLKQVHGPEAKITDLNNNKELQAKLLAAVANAPHKARKESIINTACAHINHNVQKIDAFIGKKGAYTEGSLFYGKTRLTRPNLFICMGGAGAGKTFLEKYAETLCGTNWVKVSLDHFRGQSDLYKLLVAANHHADDYTVIEPYGTALRDWAAARACEEGINLFYDGTGITYQPRYAKLAAEFKKAGFTNHVLAVDASLESAIPRIRDRFAKDNRALPWLVVTGKHTRVSPSFLQAVRDPNVDKAAIIAADDIPQPRDRYIVAETFDEKLDEFKPRSSALLTYFERLISSATSVFSGIFGDTPHNKNPKFTDENTSYLHYTVGSGTKARERTLAIYNTSRFTGMAEKGLMNAQASSPDRLTHTPSTLPFYMPEPEAKMMGAWQLRLLNQPPAPTLAAGK